MIIHNPEFKPFTEFENAQSDVKINNTDYEQLYSYSEEPEALKEILKEIKVYVISLGKQLYFPDDKQERRVLKIVVERGTRRISFKYGQSIVDTEKPLRKLESGLLYDILTCCSAEYYFPNSFIEFCSEFGYNEDSIKSRELFIKCKEQQSKLECIFEDYEISCLPS